MKITKGLGTWAGLVGALGQYLAAVALFLAADDQALALGPLATATLTLYKVLDGRFGQAVAAIENPKPAPLSFSTGTPGGFSTATISDVRRVGEAGSLTGSTFTTPRPGASMTNLPLGAPHDTSAEIPAGSVPVESRAS